MTFRHIKNNARLAQAKQWLKGGEPSVTEISEYVNIFITLKMSNCSDTPDCLYVNNMLEIPGYDAITSVHNSRRYMLAIVNTFWS